MFSFVRVLRSLTCLLGRFRLVALNSVRLFRTLRRDALALTKLSRTSTGSQISASRLGDSCQDRAKQSYNQALRRPAYRSENCCIVRRDMSMD